MNSTLHPVELAPWPSSAAAVRRTPVAGTALLAAQLLAQRVRRRRLALALFVALAAHALALFGFNQRPAAAPPPAADEGGESPVVLAVTDAPALPRPSRETVAEPGAEEPVAPERLHAALPEPATSLATHEVAMTVTPFVPVPPRAELSEWSIPLTSERAPPPRVASEQVFQLEDLDRRPQAVVQTAPAYPSQLATDNISGVVVVQFVVNAQGAIVDPAVVSAPHPLLGDAVVRCVRQWRFRPGLKNGRAVSTEMQLPVRFNPST